MTQLRFIPTRVGTTWQAKEKAAGTAVHPHARGDNESGVANGTRIYGSSPRAWGQRAIIESKDIICRFIPTRVGTTSMVVINFSFLTVHPHARGDNVPCPVRFHSFPGSSPRAWGQRRPTPYNSFLVRFIPTRVGTTRVYRRQRHNGAVHPHARGDNGSGGAVFCRIDGSSPRAWGQLGAQMRECSDRRFIPTRVGTTDSVVKIISVGPVHPHARGDNGCVMVAVT